MTEEERLWLEKVLKEQAPNAEEDEAWLEWALEYARCYWQFGTEPESQAALHILGQAVMS